MTQPEGFLVPGKEDLPELLKKVLYGTKQAPMLCNRTLKEKLETADFKPLSADGCAYICLNPLLTAAESSPTGHHKGRYSDQ